MRFSANLGFLWKELALPDAIRAAGVCGFDAVECHWPYDTAPKDVIAALDDTGLSMLGLNTAPGEVKQGEFGLSAIPGREPEARDKIDQAIAYAGATGTKSVHVMAGNSEGSGAHDTFCTNLDHACARAAKHDINILIEPLNHRDVPDYFLKTADQAISIISQLGHPNLKMMFDCYHLQIIAGDVIGQFHRCLPHIGHVQIASVPDRGPPGGGELNYRQVLGEIATAGWTRPIGAEYRPAGTTEASLSWLAGFRAI
ncbi:MAG: hydroxypyruvate isomerase family protein [Rhizobiaceae bacterium]